jgi:flavin-binding protein dodecin
MTPTGFVIAPVADRFYAWIMNCIKGGDVMSVAKVTEITASSAESFEDAVRQGIKRADKTLDKIRGAWIKEMKVDVEDGDVVAYRVDMKVTFLLKD